MESGMRFDVVRHRLSGGEQRGMLVVGSTAMTFLNKEDKIVFCHPYRSIQKYACNERGQVEYHLEISKVHFVYSTFFVTKCQQRAKL